ncbi:unnamed protein product [Zymoseptoria tritici ST99CH_1A5]|uniref:Tat pathway signal sequence n=1 Tax=Zymoseptoria tritici ST99CH_1A5 TaxID=1276529 RepID=A0A1Y6LRC0_ZYMTR|nr:unnamed protein product [Zymoseptoria tritici ST99CH_1A5]
MNSRKGQYASLPTRDESAVTAEYHYDEEVTLNLPDDHDENEAADSQRRASAKNEDRGFRRKVSINIFIAFALLLVAFFSGAAVSLIFTSTDQRQALVYPTDYPPARAAVEAATIRFSGGAYFDEQGEPYFHYDHDQTRYFGPPSHKIDRAWDNIIKHRYFLTSDEEAREAWGPDYEQYYKWPGQDGIPSGYVAGIDVLHKLHCVNHIRKALNPDYYNMTASTKFQRYHIDHCLDIIRQSLECSSDLTLNPTRWWPGLDDGKNFIDSDQVHTCRNFTKVKQWAFERWDSWHRVGDRHSPPVNAESLGL